MAKSIFFALLLTAVMIGITFSSSEDAVKNNDDDDVNTAQLANIEQASAQKNARKQYYRFVHRLTKPTKYHSKHYNRRMLLYKVKGLVRTYVTRPMIRRLTEAVNGQLELAQEQGLSRNEQVAHQVLHEEKIVQ